MNFSFHLLILTNPCLTKVGTPFLPTRHRAHSRDREFRSGHRRRRRTWRTGSTSPLPEWHNWCSGDCCTRHPSHCWRCSGDHLGICIPVEDLHQLDIVESRPSVPPGGCMCPQLPGECMHGPSSMSSIQLGGTIPVESSAEFENIQSIHTTKFRFRHYQLW